MPAALEAAKRVDKIAIIVAMKEEAAPMIAALGLKERAGGVEGAPTVIHEGTYGGGQVAVVNPGSDAKTGVNLIGTDAAALTTFLAVRELDPDLLVTAGTCGGFARKGGAVGDVYSVSSFQNHDRRIPIPGYDAFGVGLRTAAPTPNMVASLGLKTGPCTTGNSLDFIPADDERMQEAVAKDMEGAAVAWVADMLGVPIVGIKVVTDIVDGDKPTQEEFLANLGAASASLQAVVPKVVDFALGRTTDQL